MIVVVGKEMTLAEQNDAFRGALGTHRLLQGRLMVTPSVTALGDRMHDLLRRVRDFSDDKQIRSSEDERDFGAVVFDGRVWYWKIDCYDSDECEFASEQPDDPCQTYRVLTVMLEDEY